MFLLLQEKTNFLFCAFFKKRDPEISLYQKYLFEFILIFCCWQNLFPEHPFALDFFPTEITQSRSPESHRSTCPPRHNLVQSSSVYTFEPRTSAHIWNKDIISRRSEREKLPHRMESSPLSERAARRCLFTEAVKGILDQSQRRIKTSAPHFTSISSTLPEHCAAAVEVNKGRLFVLLHTATRSSLTRSISPLPPPPPLYRLYFFLSSLTVTRLLRLPLCLLLDVKLALPTPSQSVSTQHELPGKPLPQLPFSLSVRFWSNPQQTRWRPAGTSLLCPSPPLSLSSSLLCPSPPPSSVPLLLPPLSLSSSLLCPSPPPSSVPLLLPPLPLHSRVLWQILSIKTLCDYF